MTSVVDARASLEVTSVTAPVLVQDGGRAGWMSDGVPPGGALCPERLAAANHAVGNPWDAAALEAYGAFTVTALTAPVHLAIDDRALELAPGASLVIPRPEARRVRYVALRGGVYVPLVLGGRGTLPVAGLGGYAGRALRRGDRLAAGTLPYAPRAAVTPGDDARFRVLAGVDLERFEPASMETLLGETFHARAESDRVGTRLSGPRLARRDHDAALSSPMVRGAIQVTASGEAIVLGPDHPTTGGYPVIAVVIRADAGRLASALPGTAVRFTAVDLGEARAAFERYRARWLSAGP